MIKVRPNIYQTNSSSTHAMVYSPRHSEQTDKHLDREIILCYGRNYMEEYFLSESLYTNIWKPSEAPDWMEKFVYMYFRVAKNYFSYLDILKHDYNKRYFHDSAYCARRMREIFRDMTGQNIKITAELFLDKDSTFSVDNGVLSYVRKNDNVTHRLRLVADEDVAKLEEVDNIGFVKYDELLNKKRDWYRVCVYPDESFFPITDLSSRNGMEEDICFFDKRNHDIPDEIYVRALMEFVRDDNIRMFVILFYEWNDVTEYREFYKCADYIVQNGNMYVCIWGDGTRMIMCEEENPQPEYPLSVDIKITDRCNNGCPYCYESSTPEGCDGNEKIIELIKALPKETEVALGGGNPLESGLLEAILWNCNVNLSFTINQRDMDSLFSKDWFKKSYKEKEGSSLRDYINLRAVGVSVSQVDDETVEKLLALQKKFQTVVHVVAGVITLKELKKLYGKTKRLLILGYKQCGRGEEYLSPAVKERISRLADSIEEISKHFEIVAFDNLAIEQLNVKKLVSDSEWERLYQGEEGEFSMYIDAVKGEYAASSYSKERHRIEQGMSIKEMFENIRREKREN